VGQVTGLPVGMTGRHRRVWWRCYGYHVGLLQGLCFVNLPKLHHTAPNGSGLLMLVSML